MRSWVNILGDILGHIFSFHLHEWHLLPSTLGMQWPVKHVGHGWAPLAGRANREAEVPDGAGAKLGRNTCSGKARWTGTPKTPPPLMNELVKAVPPLKPNLGERFRAPFYEHC